MALPRLLPKLPGNPVRKAVHDLRQGLDHGRQAIRDIAGEMHFGPVETEVSSPKVLYEGVSDKETLTYQVDRLIDDLQHLETEHLPMKGRLNGRPCDCITKAARDVRRHGLETVPIASRQGVSPKVFDEMAKWADKMIPIGTLQAVNSGKYDEVYLEEAGTASIFRKEMEKLKGECERCPAMVDLRDFLKRRREGGDHG